ncbi:MAG: hypothetical protein R3E31_30955 [Chloroflexota bacterium]
MSESAQLYDFLHELGKRARRPAYRADEYSRILYSTDASIYRVKPHGVLIPQTVDDVQAAVELADNIGGAAAAHGGQQSGRTGDQ